MRFIIGVGPFTMRPGKTYDVDYALVFSEDSANCSGDNLCILPRARQDNIRVRNWFNSNSFPSCLNLNGVDIKNNGSADLDVKLYPSPATSSLYIDFPRSVQRVAIEIFDMLGNAAWAGIFSDGISHAVIPVSALTPGVYLVKMNLNGVPLTKKFVRE